MNEHIFALNQVTYFFSTLQNSLSGIVRIYTMSNICDSLLWAPMCGRWDLIWDFI